MPDSLLRKCRWRWLALLLALLAGCGAPGDVVAPAPLSEEEDRRLEAQDEAARAAEGNVPPDPTAASDQE
jgi:hypothetical protein